MRVSEVEVGLLFEELVQVALASNLIIRPRRVTKHTHLQKETDRDRVRVGHEREESTLTLHSHPLPSILS